MNTPPGSTSPNVVSKQPAGAHGPLNPSNWTVPAGSGHAPGGDPASGGEHGPESPSNWTSGDPGYGASQPATGGTHAPNAPFKNPGLGQ